MADVKFKRGLLAELPQTYDDGSIYITTDEGGMYVDMSNRRVRLGDFIPVDTISQLPASGHAYETAVYYVKANNILARWDATNNRWIQINKAGVVSVTNDPQNSQAANVVSSITASTNANGELSLVVSKVTVATSEDLEALADTVSSHTASINTITGNGEGSITKAVSDARAALLGNATTYTTIGALEAALAAVKTTADGAATQAATNASDISGLQDSVSGLSTRLGTAESAITTINGDATTTGSIAKAVADEATLRANADTALGGRIDGLATRMGTAETNISGNADAISAIQQTLGSGDSSLASRVTANENAITTLNGNANTSGSVLNTVNSRIAEVVNGAPEAFDTLKEIADWIGNNSDDALTMQTNIAANADDISDLKTRMTTAEGDIDTLEGNVSTINGNITTINGQITTLNADSSTAGSVDYKIAQAANTINSNISDVADDLSDLETRVEANEDAIEIINGDASTTGSIAKAVADEASARSSADTALGGRIDTLDTTVGGHTTAIGNLQDDVSAIQTLLTWQAFTA